ncbi:MAG: hypothetical protein AB7P14_29160 [Blastocatellales bacterium]
MKRSRKTRKIEITVENGQTVEVKFSRQQTIGWCPQCGAMVQVLTTEEAAQVFDVSIRSPYCQIEDGIPFLIEMMDGGL